MNRAAYAFTFFWILITRFVRAVICFFRAAIVAATSTDRAATASAASCAAAVAASAASAAAFAASVAAFAASVASAAASAAACEAEFVPSVISTATLLTPTGERLAPVPVVVPATAAVTAVVSTLPAASSV